MSSYRVGVLGRRGVLTVPDAAELAGSWSLDELDVCDLAPALADAPPTPSITAEEIAAAAAAEAERRIAEAAAAREQELADAYAAGGQAGYEQGIAEERERLAHVVAMLASATEQLRANEARWLGALESNVTALAMAAARHVIGREVKSDPSVLTDVIARAIGELPADDALTVRVHPSDLAAVSGEGVLRQIRWLGDAAIVRGGCLVEGRERIVDGRVDTALERLYRLLTHANA